MNRALLSPRSRQCASSSSGGWHCLLLRVGILLATSILVSSEGSSPSMKGVEVNHEHSDDGGRILKTARMLPKEEEPTYFPTEPPKEHKPKNAPPTSPPSKAPTSSAPTVYPTRSPSLSPTDSPSISTNPSAQPSLMPTTSPSSEPTTSQEPSGSPSSEPSSIPSSQPTGEPSIYPTTSAMPSMSPIPYARSERVDLRYTSWNELKSEIQSLARQLDYNQPTWDNLSLNPIENLDWARLTREQKNAAMQLGYDLFSWDCWQNHFQSYRWIDLSEPYIQVGQWWEELGWDISSWNRYNEEPASNELNWFELSDGERDAAENLCYFRTSWDDENALEGGFPIERPEFRYSHWMTLSEDARNMAVERLKYSALSWNVLGFANIESREWASLTEYEKEAAEGIGFTDADWDCWINHYRSYTWGDLYWFGLDLPYLALGWTELSWDGVEAAPPSKSKSWKDLTPGERQRASELCYFRDNWDGLDLTPNNGQFLYPKPKMRFVEWKALPPDVKRAARNSLLYNRASWNYMGTAGIETHSWGELTEHQKSDAVTIGFYQRTWDCFQNHYRSYKWDALDRDSRDALQVLGWSEATWKENDVPPSYDNEWDQLSENEQSRLLQLCFSKESWNGNSLETFEVEVDDGDAFAGEETASDNGATSAGSGVSISGPGTQAQSGQGSDVNIVSDVLNQKGPSKGSDVNIVSDVLNQKGPSKGSDVNIISDVLNQKEPSKSAGEMTRTRRNLCVVSAISFGTYIQSLY